MRGTIPAVVAGWLAVTPFALAQSPAPTPPPPIPYSPSQWAAGTMNGTDLSSLSSAPPTRSATVWRFSKAAGSSTAQPTTGEPVESAVPNAGQPDAAPRRGLLRRLSDRITGRNRIAAPDAPPVGNEIATAPNLAQGLPPGARILSTTEAPSSTTTPPNTTTIGPPPTTDRPALFPNRRGLLGGRHWSQESAPIYPAPTALPPNVPVPGPNSAVQPASRIVIPPASLYDAQLPQPGTQPKPGLPPVTPAPKQLPPTTGSTVRPEPLSSSMIVGEPGVSAFVPSFGEPAPEASEAPSRFWFDAEYLLWWVNGSHVPPLVTASPAGQTLIGDDKFNDRVRSGVRLRAGAWLGEEHIWGVDGSFFFLGSNHEDFALSSPGDAIVSRPFANVGLGAPSAPFVALAGPTVGLNDAQLVSFPGVVGGGVNVSSSSSLYGFDANLRRNLCSDCNHRIDLIGGYRFLALKEDLSIDESLMALGGAATVLPGTTLQIHDHFRTENYFNGGQFGLAGEYRAGNWIFGGRGTVALGVTHEIVQIDGATLVSQPGLAPTASAGGLLAQPTNIGRFTDDKFAVVPEVGVSVGYQVLPSVRLTAGYNFLYWSNVARPGDQIDLAVNPTQLPPGTLTGLARPAPTGGTSSLFVHGLTLGVEVRY